MASRRIRRVEDELNRFVEKVMRRLVFRVYQALEVSTPVDTGFARSKWTPTTGAPESSLSDRPRDESVARAQAAALLAQNKATAAALASGYTLSMGPIFIVNGAKYLVYLNQGTSAQAPAMFVEQAIATGIARTRQELP